MENFVLIQFKGEIYLVKAEDVKILFCEDISVVYGKGTIKEMIMESIHTVSLDKALNK
jgi:hypothetical protein